MVPAAAAGDDARLSRQFCICSAFRPGIIYLTPHRPDIEGTSLSADSGEAGAPLHPEWKKALADLQELFSLAHVSPELAVEIEKLFEEGSPFRVADVNWLPTIGAKHGVALYQLSEKLHRLLATARIRAGNRNADEVNRDQLSHIGSPCITPEMVEAGKEAFFREMIDKDYLSVAPTDGDVSSIVCSIFSSMLDRRP